MPFSVMLTKFVVCNMIHNICAQKPLQNWAKQFLNTRFFKILKAYFWTTIDLKSWKYTSITQWEVKKEKKKSLGLLFVYTVNFKRILRSRIQSYFHPQVRTQTHMKIIWKGRAIRSFSQNQNLSFIEKSRLHEKYYIVFYWYG